jgi:hypothetical protein
MARVSPPSYLTQLMYTVIAPFTVPMILYSMLGCPNTKSCIQKVDLPDDKRYLRILEDIPLEDVKKICRHKKATFNIIIQAILSKTIAQYIKKRENNDKEIEDITIASTFSMKPFAREESEFRMGNYVVC